VKLTPDQIASMQAENDKLVEERRGGMASTLARAHDDLPRYQREKEERDRRPQIRARHTKLGI
jgi:hypothetical protein